MEFGPLEIGTLLALSGGALGLLSRERDKVRAHALDTWDRRLRGQEIATQGQVGALAATHQPQYPALHTAHFAAAPLAPPSVTTVDAPQLPAAAVPPFRVPAFGQVLYTGLLRDGAGYLMGYALPDGTPIRLAQDEGRSLLVAGQGGSGKSTTVAVAALQELLMPSALPGQQEPARFIVVDYHARKAQGLTQRLRGLDPRVLLWAHTPAEVARAVTLFQQTCRARVAGAPSPYPLILLADEVSNMADDPDYDEVLPGLLEAFKHANNAFRAVGGKAIVGAHTLQAYAWGNRAAVRQSFHARAAGRLDSGAGTLIGLGGAQARELISLPKGQCYITAPGLAPTLVATPNLAPGDVDATLALAGPVTRQQTAHAGPWWEQVIDAIPVAEPVAESVAPPPVISRAPVAESVAAPVARLDVVPATDDRVAEALALFDGGAELPDAIEAAFRVSRKNPNGYGPAYKAVTDALRARRTTPEGEG